MNRLTFSAIKTWFWDVRIFASLIVGQVSEGLERLFNLRFKSDRDAAEESPRIDIRGRDPGTVARAVDCVRSNAVMCGWMESTIDVIFGIPLRKKSFLFHYPGRMIALGKFDLDLEEEDLSRVIARRVAYARTLRKRWTWSPCVLLRAQISVLFRELEGAIATGDVDEQELAIDRIRRRISRYQRWAWTPGRKERGNRMLRRLTSLEEYTPRYR